VLSGQWFGRTFTSGWLVRHALLILLVCVWPTEGAACIAPSRIFYKGPAIHLDKYTCHDKLPNSAYRLKRMKPQIVCTTNVFEPFSLLSLPPPRSQVQITLPHHEISSAPQNFTNGQIRANSLICWQLARGIYSICFLCANSVYLWKRLPPCDGAFRKILLRHAHGPTIQSKPNQPSLDFIAGAAIAVRKVALADSAATHCEDCLQRPTAVSSMKRLVTAPGGINPFGALELNPPSWYTSQAKTVMDDRAGGAAHYIPRPICRRSKNVNGISRVKSIQNRLISVRSARQHRRASMSQSNNLSSHYSYVLSTRMWPYSGPQDGVGGRQQCFTSRRNQQISKCWPANRWRFWEQTMTERGLKKKRQERVAEDIQTGSCRQYVAGQTNCRLKSKREPQHLIERMILVHLPSLCCPFTQLPARKMIESDMLTTISSTVAYASTNSEVMLGR